MCRLVSWTSCTGDRRNRYVRNNLHTVVPGIRSGRAHKTLIERIFIMKGIFGDLFDLNGDSELDCVEQAAEIIEFNRMISADKQDEDFSCSGIFDEDENEDF